MFKANMTRGPSDLVSDSLNSGTEASQSFFKGWLMLSLRANTGTNWPPPPFFLSPLHSISVSIFLFLSLPLLIGVHSLWNPLFDPHIPSLISLFFSALFLFVSLVFAWCSAGEPQGREIIQALCILQALWSAQPPLHWHISVFRLTQQTAYAMTNSLDAAKHTLDRDVQYTHSTAQEACVPAEQTALKKSPTKKRTSRKKEKTNESGKGERE